MNEKPCSFRKRPTPFRHSGRAKDLVPGIFIQSENGILRPWPHRAASSVEADAGPENAMVGGSCWRQCVAPKSSSSHGESFVLRRPKRARERQWRHAALENRVGDVFLPPKAAFPRGNLWDNVRKKTQAVVGRQDR